MSWQNILFESFKDKETPDWIKELRDKFIINK